LLAKEGEAVPPDAPDHQASLRRFIFRELPTIEGYLEPQDALIAGCLLEEQRRNGLAGGIAEIGIYFGRSYFFFMKAAPSGEKVVGIDLFEPGETATQADPYAALLAHGARLGLPVDRDLIIRADSRLLAAPAITEQCGKVRFFSIDGGHSLGHVKADSALARACLADHGIIAFDDAHNPLWPEVTVGISDFIRENRGGFCIVAFSRFKAYACRLEFRGLYRRVLMDSPFLDCLGKEEAEYLGSKALFLRVPMRNRLLHEAFLRLGLPAIAERAFCMSAAPARKADRDD
jgi:hypothetical protein